MHKALSKAEKLIAETEEKSKPVIKQIGTKHQQTLQHQASLSMFAKLRDEQAVKECKRVRDFLKALNHNLVKSPIPTTLEDSSKYESCCEWIIQTLSNVNKQGTFLATEANIFNARLCRAFWREEKVASDQVGSLLGTW